MLPPVHRWDVGLSPRAVVHIVHGMAEHGARYARFARALNAVGCTAWAHDHRGHGRNGAPGFRGHFADADGWTAILDDLRAVSREMARTFPSVPLILFAHSMGSFLAQEVIADRNISYAGVVLSGTSGSPSAVEAGARALARVQVALLGPRAPGRWLTDAIFGRYNRQFAPTRTRFDWLSRDAVEVDAYCEDELCGFALTSRAWCDFLEGKSQLGSVAQAGRIPTRLPIHVIGGTRDPVGENARGVKRLLQAYAAAGLTHVTSDFYSDARHELLNETNRDEVTHDVIAWMDRVVATVPT